MEGYVVLNVLSYFLYDSAFVLWLVLEELCMDHFQVN